MSGMDREGCIPDSWWGVEDDGRMRRQMVHSSTGRDTSILWVKDKEGGGVTQCLNLNMIMNSLNIIISYQCD